MESKVTDLPYFASKAVWRGGALSLAGDVWEEGRGGGASHRGPQRVRGDATEIHAWGFPKAHSHKDVLNE